MKSGWWRVTALAVLLLPAACADKPSAPAPKPTAPPPLALVAPPPPPPPTPVPSRKPKVPAATATPAAIRPPAPLPAAPPTGPAPLVDRFNPEKLIGLSADETESLLGRPTRVEEMPPGRTWQYAKGDCVLRIHMFMEMTTRSFRTLSYELNSTGVSPDVDQQCRDWLDVQVAHPTGQGG
ncbi:hypothetical protein [Niveispirillum irakense]|uniref:hypothetical protein n=1 Tax=Niveispirillum irakense TaxID=34011 RepID=UPI0012B5A9B5|nr:hypothetical protein [Niveispirillum irakense]